MQEYILSIQSQVCEGFCGNNVAVFVLRRRGHNPRFINTVQFFSKLKHVGYELKTDVLTLLLNEFNEEIMKSTAPSFYFLTGYIRSKECAVMAIQSIIKLKAQKEKLKQNNINNICQEDKRLVEHLVDINCFWLFDPVMGDNGIVYVDSAIVETYQLYFSNADIITPNQFECKLLTNIEIHTETDTTNSLLYLLNKGIKIAIITSIAYTNDPDYLYLYAGFLNHQNKLVYCKCKFPKFHYNICGTGDLFSSLLLSFIIKQKGDIFEIILKVLKIMQTVIQNSIGSVDLCIIENQDIISSTGDLPYEIEQQIITT